MHRRSTVVLSLALLLTILAGSAAAQIPTKGNVFFGYSYNRAEIVSNDGTNLNGWNGSLEGKFAPWIGLVADISGHYGSRDFVVPVGQNPHLNVSEHNFLFGPRISASVGSVRPFAELLIGAGHIGIDHGPSDTSFANAVGGGVDYRVAGPVAVRGQLDWIRTRFFDHDQNDWRFSTGLVVHF